MANVSSNQSWFDSEMANELRQLFYDQFGRQQNALNFLNAQAKAMVTNPTGFSPAAMAALRTGAIDTTSREFQHEQQALNARELQTGGADLPSGVNAQLNSSLGVAEAAQKAGEQNQITLENENLRQQNYWRAMGVLSGDAAMQSPQSYMGGSLDASAGVGALVDAATKANQSGFGSQLESGIAASLTGNSAAEQGALAAVLG